MQGPLKFLGPLTFIHDMHKHDEQFYSMLQAGEDTSPSLTLPLAVAMHGPIIRWGPLNKNIFLCHALIWLFGQTKQDT